MFMSGTTLAIFACALVSTLFYKNLDIYRLHVSVKPNCDYLYSIHRLVHSILLPSFRGIPPFRHSSLVLVRLKMWRGLHVKQQ